MRANLHETFCAALEQDRGLTEAQRISCESGPRTAREPRFVQEFTVSELKYKMPFYDSEFPPCDGRPGPDGLDPTDPLTAENWTTGCVPRELRAGEAFCGRVHPYPPGCGPHMAEFIATSLARAERRLSVWKSNFGRPTPSTRRASVAASAQWLISTQDAAQAERRGTHRLVRDAGEE